MTALVSVPFGDGMESIGQHLKKERELRHVSLEELAQTTRIPLRMLAHLEADRFDELPGDVFARGFMRSYARTLGIPSEELVGRYDESRRPAEAAPALISAITPPERGRRFGIAIALVILLILFTLALSIVLRPRHRDAAIELSSNQVTECPAPHEAPERPMPSFYESSTIATPIASSLS